MASSFVLPLKSIDANGSLYCANSGTSSHYRQVFLGQPIQKNSFALSASMVLGPQRNFLIVAELSIVLLRLMRAISISAPCERVT